MSDTEPAGGPSKLANFKAGLGRVKDKSAAAIGNGGDQPEATRIIGGDVWQWNSKTNVYDRVGSTESRTETLNNNYELFSRENPNFVQTNTDLRLVEVPKKVTIPTKFGTTLEVEVSAYTGGEGISVVIAPDGKDDDSVAVERVAPGVFNIAVADGVSGTVLPQLASRVAVRTAVEAMRTSSPSQEIFRLVNERLRRFGVGQMVDKHLAKIQESALRQHGAWVADIAVNKFKKLRADGHIASTTLATVRYDRNAGKINMAIKGDSSVVIFKTDGTFTGYNDEENHQLRFTEDPNQPYQSSGDIVKELPVGSGEVVLVCTDGVTKESLDEINRWIIHYRSQVSTHPPDRVAMAAMRHFAETKGISDDVALVAIYHP